MEKQQVTVKQAVQIAVNNLGLINVPIVLHEQIGEPIAETRKILMMCLEQMKDEPVEKAEEENGNAEAE